MVLSNASKNARYTSSITNQNQGGGSKKAGFPYQVGRSSWTSIAFGSADIVTGRCCSLKKTQQMTFTQKNTNQSRPIGSTAVNNTYWQIPGTR